MAVCQCRFAGVFWCSGRFVFVWLVGGRGMAGLELAVGGFGMGRSGVRLSRLGVCVGGCVVGQAELVGLWVVWSAE